MLKNMSIGKKLISAFMLIAMVVLVAGIFQYTHLKIQDTMSERLAEVSDRLDTINEVVVLSERAGRLKNAMMLASNVDQYNSFIEKYKESAKNIRIDLECILNSGTNDRGIKIVASPNPEVQNLIKDALSNYTEWLTITDEFVNMLHSKLNGTLDSESLAKMEQMKVKSDGHGQTMRDSCRSARAKVWANIDSIQNEYSKVVTTTMTSILVSIIICTVLALAFGVIISIMITKQMNKVISDLSEVTSGVNSGAQQINSASAQVSDSSQNIAEGANNQAASLEETSASLEQMSAMVKQNADNSRQAATMSTNANKSAQKGKEAMTKMSNAIGKIKSSSDETAKIIKTIDEIAFQTNLLALNAAVEAARAGEAGKGFAVVAEEVRNLAQRSAEAAKNTAELIEESQNNSENGVKVSTEVGGILNDIVEDIQKVGQLINEVSAATDEQSHGLEEINKAVSELDKVTQGNAANAEETASASEELSAQAAELGDHVRRLGEVVQVTRALIGGAASAENIDEYERAESRHPSETARNVNAKKHLHSELGKRLSTKHHIETTHHEETQRGHRSAETKNIVPLTNKELYQF